MEIKKAKDVKLVVQPIIGIMVYEYVFEGPCRFGEGDALTPEFDRMVGADGFRAFRENLAKYIAPVPEFEMLEPISHEMKGSRRSTARSWRASTPTWRG